MKHKHDSELVGGAAYRMPNAICATCGRRTGNRKDSAGGFGDFHHECKRDERGRLLVKPEKAKTV